MAWQARLDSVPATNNVSDSFEAVVEYFDTPTNRSFKQGIKFTAGTGLTIQQAQATVAEKVSQLNSLDETKALLEPFIGEIVA